MGLVANFEDLRIWQEARILAQDLKYISSSEVAIFKERLSKLIISIGALASEVRKQELRKTSSR